MSDIASALRSAFTADFGNGKLYVASKRHRASIGDEVVGYPTTGGYTRFQFNGKHITMHRAIFAMMYGYMPEFVDHIDRDRTNNSIHNLREVSRKQNNENCSDYKKKSSTPRGVKRIRNSFVARLRSNGVLHEGVYRGTEEEARQDYLAMAAKYHTHNQYISGDQA